MLDKLARLGALLIGSVMLTALVATIVCFLTFLLLTLLK